MYIPECTYIYIYIYEYIYIYIYIQLLTPIPPPCFLPFNALGVLLDGHVDVECKTVHHPSPSPSPPLPPSSRGDNSYANAARFIWFTDRLQFTENCAPMSACSVHSAQA